VRALVQKGRGFSEADKATLRAVELELLRKVIPEYREAAGRGQVELSTSPFYHPILPLLCDTNVYLRTHPHSRMPREPFRHPEDAAAQLEQAVVFHERLFARRPDGLWPSEGSVSDQVVPLVARAGFRWMATDEEILARTLGRGFSRDGHGHIEQPELLYRAYRVGPPGQEVACGFRDHALSDLIGFTYARWSAEAAADDFVRRVAEAGARYGARSGGAEATVFVILDGENAWEHYEGGGRPFLRALYGRLSGHPELRTVTMSDACRRAARELDGIFPGSWIDANFYIWIGHPDDQRAWSQLAEARDTLETAEGTDPHAVAMAREEVLIAEGSDWFWWYGDDHSSEHDLEFDDLFRRHLRNVYRLLNRPVPDELFVSNISRAGLALAESPPTMFISPTLDGIETSYFEWLGAGAFEIRESGGTMHQVERAPALLTSVRFGFDGGHLYIRLDAVRPVDELLGEGLEFSLKFLRPEGRRFSVRQEGGQVTGLFWDRQPGRTAWVERGPRGAAVAAGCVLEAALPFEALDVGAGTGRVGVQFFVATYNAGGVERERHPAHRPIEVAAGDPLFAASHWSA
jgi:alpha-amylase/alpha-mannosidase (GH57 family)